MKPCPGHVGVGEGGTASPSNRSLLAGAKRNVQRHSGEGCSVKLVSAHGSTQPSSAASVRSNDARRPRRSPHARRNASSPSPSVSPAPTRGRDRHDRSSRHPAPNVNITKLAEPVRGVDRDRPARPGPRRRVLEPRVGCRDVAGEQRAWRRDVHREVLRARRPVRQGLL